MEKNINYQRVEKAIKFISENFKAQPDLEQVAREINLSPFHFQKIFTEWAGVSPKRFLQYLNINYLKEKIKDTSLWPTIEEWQDTLLRRLTKFVA